MATHPEERGEGAEDLSSKEVFTTGEAARICNVSQQTIIRCFDRGRLSGFRVPGSRFRRIPRSELLRFMADNDIPLERLEGAARRALVVGADAATAASLTRALSREPGASVTHAADGFEAGLLAEALRPHAVILAGPAAGVDAVQVARLLRAREWGARVRIVAAGAAAGEEAALREMGATLLPAGAGAEALAGALAQHGSVPGGPPQQRVKHSPGA